MKMRNWFLGVIAGCALALLASSTAYAGQGETVAPKGGAQMQQGAPGQNYRAMVPKLNRPLAPTKGTTSNFQCSSTSCSCRGDRDCNDMFSSGICGAGLCDETSGVSCSCLRKVQ